MDARYLTQNPAFDIAEYFDGTIRAWGMVQNRKGQVVNRFDVDIIASREGQTIVLDETFHYYDAEQAKNQPTKRVWRITPEADGTYSGTAGDILGTASGRSYGTAFNWQYQMTLPVGDSSYTVNFDDWIWAMNDGIIINRAQIKKFGLTWAEVTLIMQKQPE